MTTVGRRLLSLAILAGIGVGAGFLVLHEERDSEYSEKERATETKVLGIDSEEEIAAISLRTPTAEFQLARREGGKGWHLQSPLAVDADDTTIDGILRHLVALRRTGVVGATNEDAKLEDITPPSDLSLFGLAPPRYQVELQTGDGESEVVSIGKRNRFDGSVYVKRGDSPHVLMVPGGIEYQVDKDLFALREKRVAVFETDDVRRLEVKAPQQARSYILEKRSEGEDGAWYLASPRALRADADQVGGLISALADLRARDFIGEDASVSERQAAGLHAPIRRVHIGLASQEEGIEIHIGKRRHEGDTEYTAMRKQGGPIALLSGDWAIRKLDVGVDALRDKRLLHFDRDRVATITIQKIDGSTLAFERSPPPKQNLDTGAGEAVEAAAGEKPDTGPQFSAVEWRLTQPEPAKAQRTMLAGLLYKMWSLEAETIVAEELTERQAIQNGLGDGALTITLRATDGAPLAAVRFGNAEGPRRYATTGVGGRLDLVDASRVEEIALDVASYRALDEADQRSDEKSMKAKNGANTENIADGATTPAPSH